jgi:hypothetical protein
MLLKGKDILRRMLKKIGVNLKKCKRKNLFLMERNELYRGGPTVGEKGVCYCFDEPWINPTYTVRSFGKIVRHGVMKNDSACQHWIIVCAASEKESFLDHS